MNTKLIKINPDNPEEDKLEAATNILKNDGLVVLPTDTVYGLAGSLFSNKAINKIYTVKKRPHDKPLPIAIADKEKIEELAKEILPATYRLIDSFWPGPLTIILKSKKYDENMGIRIPNHNIALKIIKKLGLPVVLTSANISGSVSPRSAEEALKDLDGLVDVVVDAGRTLIGKESTVVDATAMPFKILRKGALIEQRINEVVNTKAVLFVCTGNSCRSVMAKGLLEKFTKGRKDIIILSGGIAPGRLKATKETIELLQEEGIDVSEHTPTSLNVYMIKRADLILTMEFQQEQRVISLVPEARNRVYLLKEFADIHSGSLEIDDPIGRGENVYRSCFADIKEAVKRVAELL